MDKTKAVSHTSMLLGFFISTDLMRLQVSESSDGQAQPLKFNSEAVDIVLTSEQQMTYDSWQSAAETWGWRLINKGAPGEKQKLALPAVHGRVMCAEDFKAYLHQLRETQGKAGIPQALDKILASLACRNAYMFGMRLTTQQGKDLLERLKATRFCFSCAHDRPTLVPLIDMAALHKSLAGSLLEQKQLCKARLDSLKRKLQDHLR